MMELAELGKSGEIGGAVYRVSCIVYRLMLV